MLQSTTFSLRYSRWFKGRGCCVVFLSFSSFHSSRKRIEVWVIQERQIGRFSYISRNSPYVKSVKQALVARIEKASRPLEESNSLKAQVAVSFLLFSSERRRRRRRSRHLFLLSHWLTEPRNEGLFICLDIYLSDWFIREASIHSQGEWVGLYVHLKFETLSLCLVHPLPWPSS